MKKETLEEAFDRIYDSMDFTEFDFASFKLGAKWQVEQYEVLLYEYDKYTCECIEIELKRPLSFKKWFEQLNKE